MENYEIIRNKISTPSGEIKNSNLFFFGISVSDKNCSNIKSNKIPTICDSKYSKIMKEVEKYFQNKKNWNIYFSNVYKRIFKDNKYPKSWKTFFEDNIFNKDRKILEKELNLIFKCNEDPIIISVGNLPHEILKRILNEKEKKYILKIKHPSFYLYKGIKESDVSKYVIKEIEEKLGK